MKSRSNLFRYLLFLPLLGWSALAHAWNIEQFDLKAEIGPNGSVNITETITADFTNDRAKHGIIRDIPYRYTDENNKPFKTPLSGIWVTDQSGTPRTVAQSKAGSDWSLKIGDADRFVKEQEVYVIKYTVTGVINAFDEHDEFYWNVTGNEWDAPINQATALVTLPTKSQTLKAECYTGTSGSNQRDCDHQQSQNQMSAGFKTTQPLGPGEGLTIVFGWDKGLVSLPERVYEFDWKALFEPLQYLFLLIPAWSAVVVWRLRRSVKINKPIIPLYHPPKNLTLGQIGYLYNGKTNSEDLTALLIQLCVKGVMTIKETRQPRWGQAAKYRFSPEGENLSVLNSEEKWVYDHIFTSQPATPTSLSLLQKRHNSVFSPHIFYQLKQAVLTTLQDYQSPSGGLSRWLSRQIPSKEKVSDTQASLAKTLLGGMLLLFQFFWRQFFYIAGLAILFLAQYPLPIICLLTSAVLAWFRPKFNRQGHELKHKIDGYAKFLETAEKQKLNWNEAQNIFETNLPYAIALGLSDKWASVFEGKISAPQWYQSSDKTFKFHRFHDHLNGATAQAMKPTKTSHRTSFGTRGTSGLGGFGRSGGGFGGGGGRSW